MRESRRLFLGVLVSVASAGAAAFAAQGDDSAPTPPPIFVPRPLRRDPKAILRANQAAIQKDVEQLSQLVRDLRRGLNQSDTKEVLPIDVLHKAEEIEKLAKQIRELVRG